MSWLAASLVVLGLALVAGFAWYERSHPTARVLALVATLAALAALGRIAFAPLPNVKPTTDIVLLTGYALGGAPGFAVGAVAALARNVFFGQGPWTPWQMCAWGGVGVGGALLARAVGRELGRAGLAVACALAGAAYGVVMNLHLWVTYSGDHSLAKLGAYFATSLPFDLAHVVGNVLFCLLFGPALVRALDALPAALRGHLAPRARARRDAARRARCWPPPRRATPQAASPRALAGERAEPRRRLRRRPRPALDRASTRAGPASGSPPRGATRATSRGEPTSSPTSAPTRPSRRADIGDTTRTILLLRAAGLAPRIGGRDLVAELLRKRRANGSFANRVNTTAFAIFALHAPRAANDRAVRSAARWIASQANEDGGFNFAGQGRRLRDRRHRRRAAGARRRRAPRHADGPPRRALPRPPPEPRRRLPAAARRRLQRAVDRVGGPGARRRRPQPGPPAPQRRAARRSPTCARSSRPSGDGPLLAHQRADARSGSPRRRSRRSPASRSRSPRCRARSAPRPPRPPRRRARRRPPAPKPPKPARAESARRRRRSRPRPARWSSPRPAHTARSRAPTLQSRAHARGLPDRRARRTGRLTRSGTVPDPCGSASPPRRPPASAASRSSPRSCASSPPRATRSCSSPARAPAPASPTPTTRRPAPRSATPGRPSAVVQGRAALAARRPATRRRLRPDRLPRPAHERRGPAADRRHRRHRVRDGGDPAHLARPVDGRAVLPGHRLRLPRGDHRRRGAARASSRC